MSNVALMVLAAGYSRRFGAANKLLAEVNGKPVLETTLDQTATLEFTHRLAVINPDSNDINNICKAAAFETIQNNNAREGMGSSIAAGMQHLHGKKMDAVMIALGDMPFVLPTTYQAVFENLHEIPGKTIIAPAYKGKRGHPVLFTNVHFDALGAMTADQGAKKLINENADSFLTVEVNDPGILTDIDRPADLLQRRQ